MQSSCMNKEIKSFNTKLKKMVKVYQHMSVLEMDNDKKIFIICSLHLNGQGKEVLSKLIVCYTYSLLEQKIDAPIILNWKSDQNLTAPLNQIKVINRTSSRTRKTPSMKSCDFFMVNRDLSVGDNSLINGSIKVMRSLSMQRDNLKCKKQSPKSLHLRWKPEASNDPQSNENKRKSAVLFHQNVRGSVKQIRRINNFLVCSLSPGTLCN